MFSNYIPNKATTVFLHGYTYYHDYAPIGVLEIITDFDVSLIYYIVFYDKFLVVF